MDIDFTIIFQGIIQDIALKEIMPAQKAIVI